jgi:predicted HicB family RNase H-like nuclease
MKAISIWISEDEHEDAKTKADAEDLSLSQLVRKLLRDFSPKHNDRQSAAS